MKKLSKLVMAFTLVLSLVMVTNVNAILASQADGEYEVELKLVGGSGRASVESPAKVKVQSGEAVLTVIWSSSNYDYMIVDGVKYNPVNSEGNSTFCIPIDLSANAMTVIADTTAMSTPHEIEYELEYTLLTAATKKEGMNTYLFILVGGAIAGGIGGYAGAKRAIDKKKQNSDMGNE